MLAACTNAKQKLPRPTVIRHLAHFTRILAQYGPMAIGCLWVLAGCTTRGAGWQWPHQGVTIISSSPPASRSSRIGLAPEVEIGDTWTSAALSSHGATTSVTPPDRSPQGASAVQVSVESEPPVVGWPTEWNAEAPERSWRWIVLHHSGTERGSVNAIDREHRRQTDRKGNHWLGIGYHFVIGNGRGMEDGAIEPTFRWKQQLHGAHAGSETHNESGIGICLIGNFEDQPPTPAQQQAATQLVELLAIRFQLPRDHVLRHGDLKRTECPGHHFPFDAIAGRAPAESVEIRRDIRAAWRGAPTLPALR